MGLPATLTALIVLSQQSQTHTLLYKVPYSVVQFSLIVTQEEFLHRQSTFSAE